MTEETKDQEVDRGDTLPDETEEKTEEKAAEEESTEKAAESTASGEDVNEDKGETKNAETEEESTEQMLPKSRYDSVQARNKALQDKLDRMEREREEFLEAQKKTSEQDDKKDDKQSPEARLVELDDQINDALLDGDKTKANELRREQRDIERQMFQDELTSTTQNATAQAREQVRLDATVDFLEATYDVLNVDSKEFNQAAVDEMEGLRQAFESTGQYTPSQALLKAAKYMFPDVPHPEDTPAEKKSDADAIEKATEASNKQPPDIKDTGQDADSGGIQEDIDPKKVTMKDIESLPAATLAKLRGDIL